MDDDGNYCSGLGIVPRYCRKMNWKLLLGIVRQVLENQMQKDMGNWRYTAGCWVDTLKP